MLTTKRLVNKPKIKVRLRKLALVLLQQSHLYRRSNQCRLFSLHQAEYNKITVISTRPSNQNKFHSHVSKNSKVKVILSNR